MARHATVAAVVAVLCIAAVACGEDYPILAVDPPAGDGGGAAGDTQRVTAEATLSKEPFATGSVFEATDEWQEIGEGQAIPPGLHVEINLETGKKRAKKLEHQPGVQTLSEKRESKLDRMKEFLMDLDDGGNYTNEAGHMPPSAIANMTKEERDEILEELFTKDDIKQMKKLVTMLTNASSTDEDRYNALDGLEYYVHQVDNANDLDTIGGLVPVLNLLGNSPNNTVRVQAAAVVGVLTQNNPHTQSQVLSRGALPVLIELTKDIKEAAGRKRLMFALSSVLRRRIDAQRAFIELDGDVTLQGILADTTLDKGLRVKVVTLLYDVLYDEASELYQKQEGHKFVSTGDIREMRTLAPYVAQSALGRKGINPLLCKGMSDLLVIADGNVAEKSMETIVLMAEVCKGTFGEAETQARITAWRTKWTEDLENEAKGDNDAEMLTFYGDLVHVAETTLRATARS